MARTTRDGRVALLLAALVWGCGSGSANAGPPTSKPSEEPHRPTDADWAELVAPLRPPGTQGVLAELACSPDSPEAYAQAAVAYAATEVGGMTLFWGMTYKAMGGRGTSDAKVAGAIAQVLKERVGLATDQGTLSIWLAPGPLPGRKSPDGDILALFAGVFETSFALALHGFRGKWNVAEYHRAVADWVNLVEQGVPPFGSPPELVTWLGGIAKVGHLEAYCFDLLGPAFPDEYATYESGHAAALSAAREHIGKGPFRPRHVVMPDDLVKTR